MTTFKSKIFPTAVFRASQLDELSQTIEGQIEAIADYGTSGYALLGEHLVPFSFINRVTEQLDSELFHYDRVLDPREMVGDDFYESLSDVERCVLSPCLLMIFEQGSLSVVFPGEQVDES